MANTGTENTSTKSDCLPIESRDLLIPKLEELVQGMVIMALLRSMILKLLIDLEKIASII